jgi:Flp pilus assembly protein TadB
VQAEKEKAHRQAAEARKQLQAAEERREAELDKARAEAKDALHDHLRRADEREAALALTVQQLRASLANVGEQSAVLHFLFLFLVVLIF